MNQLQDDKEVVAEFWELFNKNIPSDVVGDLPQLEKDVAELIAKRENRALIKGYDLGIQSWAEGKKRVKEIRKQLSSTKKGKDGV